MPVTAQRISEAYKSKGKNDLTDDEIADIAGQLSNISWGGVNDNKSTSAVKSLLTGGNTGLGAQMQGYVTGVMDRVSKYHSNYLTAEEKKLQTINPNLKVSTFYNPVAETYNWGEGASANRSRVVLDPWLRISEQSKALKAAQAAAQEYQKTGQLGAAPDIKGNVLKLYNGAYKSVVDSVTRGLDGKLSAQEKEQANAAAARVGAPLPYKDTKVGNIAEGGAVTNETMKSGVSYEQQAANVLQGKTAVPTEAAKPIKLSSAAQKIKTQLEVGQNLNAQQKANLEKQFQSAAGMSYQSYLSGGKSTSTTSTNGNNNAMSLVDKVFLERKDVNNYNNESWWQGQDLATRQEAYNLIKKISSSPQELAKYVLSKGITNLQNYSWWTNNPYKQAAWNIIQQQQKTASGTSAGGGNTDTGENTQTKSYRDLQNADEVSQWLNDLQNEDFANEQAADVPPVRGEPSPSSATDLTSPENIKKNTEYFNDLLGGGEEAPAFNAESKLASLRTQYGIDDLETQMADFDKQVKDLEAAVRIQTIDEQGKPVAMGVIGGRINEVQRQAMEKMDFLNRQKSYVADQLKTKYGVVDQIMKAAQLDYTNATDKYNTEYAQNLQAINLMRGIEEAAKTDQEKEIDNARANLQVIYNNIANGAMDVTTLNDQQKILINKLESQSGLPPGTMSSMMKKGAGFEIKATKDGMDADGNTGIYIIKENKATGQVQAEFIQTMPAGSGGLDEKNIANKYVMTDSDGKQWLMVTLNSGEVKKIYQGDTGKSDSQEDAQKRKENFTNMLLDIKEKMGKSELDSGYMTIETAKSLLKTAYPSISEENITKLLTN